MDLQVNSQSDSLAPLGGDSIFDCLRSKKRRVSTEPRAKSSRPREKAKKWTEEDTRLFYKCLELFGMDFSLFRRLLEKSDRQIIRKFHKEKKRNAKLIDEAISLHQSNLAAKNESCKQFFDSLWKNSSAEEMSQNSDVSLEGAVSKRLAIILEEKPKEEKPIESLDFYMNI